MVDVVCALDTRIVVSGFGTQYGGQYLIGSGDSIRLLVRNAVGPELTFWAGTLP